MANLIVLPYPRWRFGFLALTAVLAIEGIVVLAPAFVHLDTLGSDYATYMDRTRSWLAGTGFYLPGQLAGPYFLGGPEPPALYPPPLLYVLVPFTFLPAVLWWIVPLGIIAYSLYRLRPAPWTWPILAAVLCYPRTWIAIGYGNPSMWAFAALAAGFIWTWPLAFVAIKPMLGPFALIGARRRSFWIGAGGFVLVGLPFTTMWLDYAAVLVNARNDLGLDYLFGELPIAAALTVAWVGRLTR